MDEKITFCTAIICMDGRIQIPVIHYLKERFGVDYVDIISEPGPNAIISKKENSVIIKSILDRLKISVDNHESLGIAVVGHHDCAGNPVTQAEQTIHTLDSIQFIRQYNSHLTVIGLWVDENSHVTELN